jgi:16S rRNA (uracil1498-N3)-methyltransferase
LITLLVDPRRFDAAETSGGAYGGPTGESASAPIGSPGKAAAELVVEGDAYRHLFRARRMTVGERLRVVDGAGRARWGEVVGVGRNSALVALGEPAAANEPRLRLELLVATLRPERAAWLVEKATELGISAVRFLNTDRGPRSFGEGTAARLRRVAGAAVEQCHRARCPEVTGPHPFAELARLAAAGRRWLLDPAAPVSGFDLSASPPSPPPSLLSVESLLVGPEGGWSPAEAKALAAAGWQRVSLGPRTLRIETAALAGAALLLLPARRSEDEAE